MQCVEEREPAAGRQYRKRNKQKKKNQRKKDKLQIPHHSFPSVNRRIRVMKKWFHVFFKNRWGRGQPDDIGAMNLGDEKFDPDSDKKPRAGQILWIRGLTRLQTQVTIPISFSFFLSFSQNLGLYFSTLYSLSIYVYLSISISYLSYLIAQDQYSLVLSHEQKKKKKRKLYYPPPPIQRVRSETTLAFI